MRKHRPTFNDTALARRPGGTLVPHRAFTENRITDFRVHCGTDLHPHDVRLVLLELGYSVSASDRNRNNRKTHPLRS